MIDALNEAGAIQDDREVQQISRELLRPLSSLSHVWLLIGTSRPLLGAAVQIIDR